MPHCLALGYLYKGCSGGAGEVKCGQGHYEEKEEDGVKRKRKPFPRAAVALLASDTASVSGLNSHWLRIPLALTLIPCGFSSTAPAHHFKNVSQYDIVYRKESVFHIFPC